MKYNGNRVEIKPSKLGEIHQILISRSEAEFISILFQLYFKLFNSPIETYQVRKYPVHHRE